MKAIQMIDLYNMMNDNRHLVIGDLRHVEQFDQMQIRGSCCIQDDANKISQYIQSQNINGAKNEEKYKTQPIRRLVLVIDEVNKIEDGMQILIELIESLNMKQYKLYYLKVPVEQFLQRFPFFQLSKKILENYEQMNSNDDQTALLFSYSQFPQQLFENSVFLGSNFNANSRKQLECLKIKTIIDFKVYEENAQLSDWKREQYNYIHYPINQTGEQVIDFKYLTETIESSSKPVMLCCPDGNSITNIAAIGYLMTLKKQNFNFASLKVFQLRGNTTINKNLYSQILTYNPK